MKLDDKKVLSIEKFYELYPEFLAAIKAVIIVIKAHINVTLLEQELGQSVIFTTNMVYDPEFTFKWRMRLMYEVMIRLKCKN